MGVGLGRIVRDTNAVCGAAGNPTECKTHGQTLPGRYYPVPDAGRGIRVNKRRAQRPTFLLSVWL